MSHLFGGLFKPFVEQRPVCVMARCVLENLLNPQRMDALFERTAKVQYTRDLVFSSVVDLMGQVVLGLQTIAAVAYILFIVFPAMGRNYDAAVIILADRGQVPLG